MSMVKLVPLMSHAYNCLNVFTIYITILIFIILTRTLLIVAIFHSGRHFEVLLRRFVFPASEVDHTAISSSPKEHSIDDEAIHILMVAIKSDKTGNSDEELSEKFYNFCQQKVSFTLQDHFDLSLKRFD